MREYVLLLPLFLCFLPCVGARSIVQRGEANPLQLQIEQLRGKVAELASAMKPKPTPPHPCSKDGPMMWPCSARENTLPAEPTVQFKKVMVVQAHPDDESMGSGMYARTVVSDCTLLDLLAGFTLPADMCSLMMPPFPGLLGKVRRLALFRTRKRA